METDACSWKTQKCLQHVDHSDRTSHLTISNSKHVVSLLASSQYQPVISQLTISSSRASAPKRWTARKPTNPSEWLFSIPRLPPPAVFTRHHAMSVKVTKHHGNDNSVTSWGPFLNNTQWVIITFQRAKGKFLLVLFPDSKWPSTWNCCHNSLSCRWNGQTGIS